jgi:hypothetical protein
MSTKKIWCFEKHQFTALCRRIGGLFHSMLAEMDFSDIPEIVRFCREAEEAEKKRILRSENSQGVKTLALWCAYRTIPVFYNDGGYSWRTNSGKEMYVKAVSEDQYLVEVDETSNISAFCREV